MGKYGQAAVRAVTLLNSKKMASPLNAWNQATIEIFGEGTSSQVKGCPRGAFIGLCEEGLIQGIPEGKYSYKSNSKNKEYAMKAVELIRKDAKLADDINHLWNEVIGGKEKVHNYQMDVVVTLRNNGLLVTD
ncbi:hypothetical protein QFZ28_003219 [Neobacillus niacini]|jgi:hypothetical protein|uniref:DUF6979 family protein n=1 Tax=Neobacillus niacini TaxID=86668 RepID=UPI002782EA5F|nr:hypothetical protein [Neobacillus niacini]MDQ1002819.1 hypothetical protein [Neobacillus niacini]